MNSSEDNKNITEEMYSGVGLVFKDYLKRFKEFSENNEETSVETINNLGKISGSLGYMAQVHAGLAKAYEHEKRLVELEKKFGKIPAGFLKEIEEKAR